MAGITIACCISGPRECFYTQQSVSYCTYSTFYLLTLEHQKGSTKKNENAES